MNHCETCKSWEKDKDYSVGECRSDKLYWGYGILPREVPPDSALVEDDEGWGMMTGPKFGCVQWEAKS